MSFFKKIFKKKPGGTFVGNILRGVGDKFTGGIYSSIFPRPAAKAQTAAAPTIPAKRPAVSNVDTGGEDWKNWGYLAGGVVGLGGLYYLILARPSKGRRRYKRRY